MGRNLDRGLEDRNEKDRYEDYRSRSGSDDVIEKTRNDIYDTLNDN